MDKAIDVWYHQMTDMEKRRAYEFFNRTKAADEDRKLETQQRFLARFNPDNQYEVYTEFEGTKEVNTAYRFEDKYFLNTTTFISKGHITKVEKKQ